MDQKAHSKLISNIFKLSDSVELVIGIVFLLGLTVLLITTSHFSLHSLPKNHVQD
jgi:hypothetical protein